MFSSIVAVEIEYLCGYNNLIQSIVYDRFENHRILCVEAYLLRLFPLSAGRWDRQSLFPFLISLLSGAVVGAVCAYLFLQNIGSSGFSGIFSRLDSESFLRKWFLTLLFPALIYGAALTAHASVAALVFFFKSVCFSFIFCLCVNCGAFPQRAAVYRALFFHSILPLPVCFYSASILFRSEDALHAVTQFRLLFLNLVSTFLCVCAEIAVNVVF